MNTKQNITMDTKQNKTSSWYNYTEQELESILVVPEVLTEEETDFANTSIECGITPQNIANMLIESRNEALPSYKKKKLDEVKRILRQQLTK